MSPIHSTGFGVAPNEKRLSMHWNSPDLNAEDANQTHPRRLVLVAVANDVPSPKRKLR